jgi:tetratricopeptide (TPR) repeat protein
MKYFLLCVLIFSACSFTSPSFIEPSMYSEKTEVSLFSPQDIKQAKDMEKELLQKLENIPYEEAEFSDIVALGRAYSTQGYVGKALDVYLFYGKYQENLFQDTVFVWNIANLFEQAQEYEKALELIQELPENYAVLKKKIEIGIRSKNKELAQEFYTEFQEKTGEEDDMLLREIKAL